MKSDDVCYNLCYCQYDPYSHPEHPDLDVDLGVVYSFFCVEAHVQQKSYSDCSQAYVYSVGGQVVGRTACSWVDVVVPDKLAYLSVVAYARDCNKVP